MDIQKLGIVYFSPTGSTKKVMRIVSKAFDLKLEDYDLTDYLQRDTKITFTENDFVIFGIPVFGGRVPVTMTKRLENIAGNKTATAIIATYGNHEYNGALLELKNLVERRGFKVIGAAAFVTEHSVVRTVATGRPNQADEEFIIDFGKALLKKITAIRSLSEEADLHVSGKIPFIMKSPGRKYIKIPMVPKFTTECNHCKACVKACPEGAISFENPKVTDKNLCIRCMRCIRVCPNNARQVGEFLNWVAKTIMNSLCKEEKKPEMFL